MPSHVRHRRARRRSDHPCRQLQDRPCLTQLGSPRPAQENSPRSGCSARSSNAKGNSRFIPVLLDDAPEATIPLPLDGHTRYRIRAFDLADPDFEALYRELTGQPKTPKPTLGDVIKLDARRAPIAANALPEKKAVWDFASDGRALDESAPREPSPTETGSAETAAPHGGFWSPFSNEDSVARGEARFWAIVETLAAMAVFWWVAIRYETFFLLTTSLFVAPLLLLRSAESTRLGVKWFDEGMFPPRWPDDPSARAEAERRWQWRWLGISAASGSAIGFGLAYLYLVGHEGWSAFGRVAGLVLTIWWLVGASSIARAIARDGVRAKAGPEAIAEAVARAVARAVGRAKAGPEAIADAVTRAVGRAVGRASGTAATLTLAYGPSIFLGILFATFVRPWSPVQCFVRGRAFNPQQCKP